MISMHRTPCELDNARRVWLELVLTGEARMLDWQAWCEKALSAIDFPPPAWLLDMRVESEFAALQALLAGDAGVGCDGKAGLAIDTELLALGTAYARHREAPWDEIWRQLLDVGDPESFVASGRWMELQWGELERPPDPFDPDITAHLVFAPLGRYAVQAIRACLGEEFTQPLAWTR